MRNLLLTFALAMMMVTFITACQATENNWHWSIGVGSDYQDSTTGGGFGVAPTASDDYDTQDLMIIPGPKAYLGTYHEEGKDGWTGETGFYRRDYRSPFPMEPGLSKTWIFYIWADPTLGPLARNIDFSWSSYSAIMPPVGVDIYLKLLSKPSGITGGPAVGTVYNLGEHSNGYINLPVFRTSNGLEGYKFELTAAVVPEPSSLLALAGGLAGVGGLFLRKRK